MAAGAGGAGLTLKRGGRAADTNRMLRRPAALVVLVPLVTILALVTIGVYVQLVQSRMVPIGFLTSGVVAGVLASRDHGPLRAGAGIGAAAMYLVLFVVFIFLLLALAGPGAYD